MPFVSRSHTTRCFTPDYTMDFGGSSFDHHGADDAQLFDNVLEHDFSVPLAPTTALPPHFTQLTTNTAYPSGSSRSNTQPREGSGRPILQRHDRSPLGPRTGAGILKRSPPSSVASGALKQTLAQSFRKMSSLQALEDKIIALNTRMEEKSARPASCVVHHPSLTCPLDFSPSTSACGRSKRTRA